MDDGALTLWFQPIVDLRDDELKVAAVHARTRDRAGSASQSDPTLSERMRRHQEEVQFDRHMVGRALSAATDLRDVLCVHVDVHVATLERDPSFPAHVEIAARAKGFDLARLTLELIDHSPHFDAEALLQFMQHMRLLGVKVGIDHASSGHRMIVDVHPDYFRIDPYFVIGCATDRFRGSIIRSVVQVANDFGATVIAEGIDTDAELYGVRRLGVTLGQGALFERPATGLQWAGKAPSEVPTWQA